MQENTLLEVSGIVYVGLSRVHVTICPDFLILDCESYARDLLVTQEDAIAKIEIEDGDSGAYAETVQLLRRTTVELREWLTTRKSAIRSIPTLKRRLQIQNQQVRAGNMRHYARVLLSLSLMADETDVPQFVVYASSSRPRIYVTRALRFVAAHTGRDVLGVVESDEKMAMRVKMATTDKIPKP